MDTLALDYKTSSALKILNQNSLHEFILKRYGGRNLNNNQVFNGPDKDDLKFNNGPLFDKKVRKLKLLVEELKK